ncbi:MAG TPA: benzoyl-CoA 2,3-epoxidase subunit BoxB [Acidimicrobiaceae bacterium]|nr:benzoyl-CoA 2,3-epoxidase subunit BoxB [Acidimicrobiaceae bacterium]HCB37277.1 benzoyl-CoA 2,3-epoxidase subunit BoxB [Acidimicrobiaceae bacterium]
MTAVDYSRLIPNNVGLADDRRLLRALEGWHPKFARWWADHGPADWSSHDVYLRTAVDLSRSGWAHYDFVKLPEYRWGIFMSEPKPDRRVGFGDRLGEPVWQELPGEFRADLRRLIVVQGDTEPASVEQQRRLGATAPSLYDLRNLLQINVEEGRHLWAMVYLLHAHFGRDGRDEADALLERHSGDPDNPRILGAFNERTADWLSFLMFTYFTDRDGKFQLGALAESAFDPLSRTCEFMLREEAHHMFVGSAGVGRVVQRTCELMVEHDTADVRPHGGIDLATLQRYVNFHYSVSLDLFGSETSTNAAGYYSAGLKGRFAEASYDDDHVLTSHDATIECVGDDGTPATLTRPAVNLVNAELRRAYRDDCAKGLRRWNRVIAESGVDFVLTLPHDGFHRDVGVFAGHHVAPDGRLVTADEWSGAATQYLPGDDDHTFVQSLMQGCFEPGEMASWIAPPERGVNGRPLEFEYVRL